MISTTKTTKIAPPLDFKQNPAEPKPTAGFTMGGEEHEFAFDGQVDDVFLGDSYLFKNLDKNDGHSSVADWIAHSDFRKAEQAASQSGGGYFVTFNGAWQARRFNNGTLNITSMGPGPSQTIEVNRTSVKVTTQAAGLEGETVSHSMSGILNRRTGAITCLDESVTEHR